jgi:hypothetical protein
MSFKHLAAGLGVVAFVAAGAVTATPFPRVFTHSISRLRVVAFPVLLPATFNTIDLHHVDGSMFVRTDASAHHYVVHFNYDALCDGANVCSEGSLSAYDDVYARAHPGTVDPAGPQRPDADERDAIRAGMLILDRRVVLAHGRIGYYTEGHSGADDGGNSSLRWHDGHVEYEVETRISTLANLTRTADSAIENGPLF